MNFYKHHLGDYAQATSHLSFVEDAAYSRCMRKYYAEEKPLPADLKAVQRLIGARTREEKEATQAVLEEFFELQADGWHNKRCDEELAAARAQAETNRRIAEEREARKRARTEHESSNASSHEQSTNRPPATMGEREPSQTPLARHQTPEEEKDPPAARVPPAAAGRKPAKRCPEDFEVTPELRAWAAAKAPGVNVDRETEAFRDWTFKDSKTDWPATWRTWMRKASPMNGAHASPNRQTATDKRVTTIEALTGRSRSHERPADAADIIDIAARVVS